MKARQLAAMVALSIFMGIDIASAQKVGDWTVGVVFQPSFFKMYNEYDWDEPTGSRPAKPNQFSGLAGGVFSEYAISHRFGLGVELAYSRQYQKYFTELTATQHQDGSETKYAAITAKIRLDYLKMPLLANLNFEIGDGSGLFLKIMGGPQLSFNMDYSGKNTHYDARGGVINYDDIVYETAIKPTHFHHDFKYTDGTHSIVDEETEYLYHRLELGLVGGVSLQKRIFGTYGVSVGIRVEQGLTGIEKPGDMNREYVTLASATGQGSNRPATRTRRVGLSIGVSKTFE